MQVEQYVMAYEVEQDRLRALLPAGFVSLRPVLRINGEIRRGPEETAYLELNTPVEGPGKRGWPMPEREKPSPSPPPFSLSPLRRLGWRAGALRNGTTRGASFWGRPCLFGPASLETATRNFVTVSLLGSFLRGTPRAPARGKPYPPLQQLPGRRMKSAPSPRKTRRPFPAGRCWGPMWFGGSGGRTRRSRGPERGSRFG